MRRSLLVLVVAPLVLSTLPASAQIPDEFLLCDAPSAGTTVLKANETQDSEPPAPQYDAQVYTYTNLRYQLDLSPATAINKTQVTATLSWQLDVNDWDLFLLDEQGNELAASESVQAGPLEDPPTEQVTATLSHCSLFTISIKNWQAVAVDAVDPLQLQVGAGSVS